MSGKRSALMVKLAKDSIDEFESDSFRSDTESDDTDEDPTFGTRKENYNSKKTFQELLKRKLKELNKNKIDDDSSSSNSENEQPKERYPGLVRASKCSSPTIGFIDDDFGKTLSQCSSPTIGFIDDDFGKTLSQVSSPASAFACLMSADSDNDETIKENLEKENLDLNLDENSDQILNNFEKEADLDSNVGENLDFNNENQCENYLADQRRVPSVKEVDLDGIKNQRENYLADDKENSNLNINANSDRILNNFEKGDYLDGNIRENFDLDYENQRENHLADHGKVPYTANDILDSEIPVTKRNKRIWDKKDLCLYCYEDVTNFSRHLIRKHPSEMAVKQFLKMKTGSIERRNFIEILRKRGNFLAPAKKEIKLVKRSAKKVDPANVLACQYCKGFYVKRYLRKHVLRCIMKPDNSTPKKSTTAAAQTYIAQRTLEADFYESFKLKDGVQKMRSDKIALIAKSDPLILSFGSYYAKRHCHDHLHKVTRNKLREYARLWIEVRRYTEDKSLFNSLKPENFKYFILGTKEMSGYDEHTQRFKNAPTLALHMGTNLIQLCDHAFSEIMQKNKVFTQNIDVGEKAKEIKTLRRLIKTNWNAELSSVANQNVMENQWKKPTIIPLTSDIQTLNQYVMKTAKRCYKILKQDPENRNAFNELQKSSYTLLITLNRRRIGELERTPLEAYLKENNDIISDEFIKDLNEAEKILLKRFKRITIRGKRHKPVPVLISTDVQKFIDLLLSVRSNFIPESNLYLFATIKKDSNMDGYTALRNFAKKCGAKHPEALTSGRLRKHIATISQVENLSDKEMEQLCTFLGHTMDTHKNFYRLPQEVYQTAKLASYLLRSQNEKGVLELENDDHLEEELDTDRDSDLDMDVANLNDLDKEVTIETGAHNLEISNNIVEEIDQRGSKKRSKKKSDESEVDNVCLENTNRRKTSKRVGKCVKNCELAEGDEKIDNRKDVSERTTRKKKSKNAPVKKIAKSIEFVESDEEETDEEVVKPKRERTTQKKKSKNAPVKKIAKNIELVESDEEETDEEVVKPKRGKPKIRWTEEQKKLTLQQFQSHIRRKKCPTETEIEDFRKKHQVMSNKDWKKIKVFVFNAYMKPK